MVKSYTPASVVEALEILNTTYAKIYAGGTDIMVNPSADATYMFTHKIRGIDDIYEENGFLHIGSGVIMADALKSPLVPEIWKKSIIQIASPAIRNTATIGGNICNASPAADSLPFLFAADAAIVTAHLDNGSVIYTETPINKFIIGVKKTILKKGGLVTGVKIPTAAYTGFTHCVFEKVASRKAEAISKLTFIGLAKVRGNIVEDFRTAYGAVSITTLRKPEIDSILKGKTVDYVKVSAESIAEMYAPFIRPIDDQRSTADYRKTVALNLLKDFLINIK